MTIEIPVPPADGELVSVMPGIWWLRMPIPFKLDHVNIWLLEDNDGWTVIDTGVSSGKARAIWQDVITRHLNAKPITRIIVTHSHPDHVGYAGSLCARTGAKLFMSRSEWLWTAWEQQITEAESRRLFDEFKIQVGLDQAITWDEVYKDGTMADMTDIVPRGYIRLQDGDRLEIGGHVWKVLTGEGHSLEHVCLYCAEIGVLISADHVLPRISPNIGVSQTEPEGNPLGEFIRTLTGLAALPADTLVLPSHNEPFYGLRERIVEVIDHHKDRLAVVRDKCVTPLTVAEAARALFERPMFGYDIRLAAIETWSHLNSLVDDGELRRWADGSGAYRFQKA